MSALTESDVPGAKLKNFPVEVNTVADLKRWLACRGVSKNCSKSELVKRVQECIENGNSNRILVSVDKGIWHEKKYAQMTPGSAFDIVPKSQWTGFPTQNIPSLFTFETIKEYVSQSIAEDDSDSDSELLVPVSATNNKSMRRGNLSYRSGHVRDIEDNMDGQLYYIRANVIASYKDIVYKTIIKIAILNSKIISAKCQCKAAESLSCSHIIALLYALEDYTIHFGYQAASSTSRLNEWNKGRKRGKDPKSVLEASYPKFNKTEQNRKRFLHNNLTAVIKNSQEHSFVKDLQTLPTKSMFQCILKLNYDDFLLNSNEEAVLSHQVSQMVSNLRAPRNGSFELLHIQNTHQWRNERRVRVTASVAKSFYTATQFDNKVYRQLWDDTDLSEMLAIKYGRENEHQAFLQYRTVTGNDVRKAGFNINNLYPGLGCSPDGLIFENGIMTGLVEVKCPYRLRNVHPEEVCDVLNSKTLFYAINSNNNIQIKRNHDYYYQVQLSLGLLNLNYCDFIVWSVHGFVTERIQADTEFIAALTKKLINIHNQVILPEFFQMRLPRELKLKI